MNTFNLFSFSFFLIHQSSIAIVKKSNRIEYQCHDHSNSYTINPSTTIFLSEAVKVLINLSILRILYFYQHEPAQDGSSRICSKRSRPFESLSEIYDFLIPALLYTLQNHLLYISLKELDPPIFLLTSQLKILTTALASVIICKRRYRIGQWVALCLLTIGVTIVQLEPINQNYLNISIKLSQFKGVLVMILSSSLSGLAGAWFERSLKKPESGGRDGRTNLWRKNSQLSICSLLVSFIMIFINPQSRSHVLRYGLLAGFSSFQHPVSSSPSSMSTIELYLFSLRPWFIVLYHSIGGILVSILVNQFDSVTKNFATCLSVIISGLISSFSGSTNPSTLNFYLGCFLVFLSIKIFSDFSSINHKHTAQKSRSADSVNQRESTPIKHSKEKLKLH